MTCRVCGQPLLLVRPGREICARCLVGNPTNVAVRTPVVIMPKAWVGEDLGPVVVPEPETRARVATAEEITGGAKATKAHAEKCGWSVVAHYARGTDMGKREPCVVDSIVLRLSRLGGARAVASWVDNKFSSAFVFEDGWIRLLAAELRCWLALKAVFG